MILKAHALTFRRTILSGAMIILLLGCIGMDNESIPLEQFDKVKISDFEVNLERDYIRGRIENQGTYDITTSIFKLILYSQERSATEGSNQVPNIRHVQASMVEPNSQLFTQNFVVREQLKPNYSTEFYFELKLDYEGIDILYTYEIIDLKGKKLNAVN